VIPKTLVPALEDVLWAELLLHPVVKQLRRNRHVLSRFAANGWITHTSRKNEFAITEPGRRIGIRRLEENWPEWKRDLQAFREAGLSPENGTAWRILKRQKADHIARSVQQINRRTLSAWERTHSKSSSKKVSERFRDVQVTVDEVARLRVSPGSKLLLTNGSSMDCDLPMATFGEVMIPERGWNHIGFIDVPNSRMVCTVENKGAFVDFPMIDSATLVLVPGDNTSSLRNVLSRLTPQPVVHFGDFDPKGLAIYEALRGERLVIDHFVPNYIWDFVPTHALDCETPWPERDYSSFHRCISELVSAKRWLEQEALVLDERFEKEVRCQFQRFEGRTIDLTQLPGSNSEL
jgi:hypothetical protein